MSPPSRPFGSGQQTLSIYHVHAFILEVGSFETEASACGRGLGAFLVGSHTSRRVHRVWPRNGTLSKRIEYGNNKPEKCVSPVGRSMSRAQCPRIVGACHAPVPVSRPQGRASYALTGRDASSVCVAGGGIRQHWRGPDQGIGSRGQHRVGVHWYITSLVNVQVAGYGLRTFDSRDGEPCIDGGVWGDHGL